MRTDADRCPRQACPLCRRKPISYPYHPECEHTLGHIIRGAGLLQNDGLLRLAEAMTTRAAGNRKTPTPSSLIKTLGATIEEISNLGNISSPMVHILEDVYNLPLELCEKVLYYLLDGPGGHVLFESELRSTLGSLIAWPERRHQEVSIRGGLYARWSEPEGDGGTARLAGLYDCGVMRPLKVILFDEEWDFVIVKRDTRGIVDVKFIRAVTVLDLPGSPYFVQVLKRPDATINSVWVTLQVSNVRGTYSLN